jgi:hypothetical protein
VEAEFLLLFERVGDFDFVGEQRVEGTSLYLGPGIFLPVAVSTKRMVVDYT